MLSPTCTRSFASFEKFNFEDPLNLNSLLSEEERMISDSARAYATENLMPRVIEAHRKEYFDRDIMTEMGKQGYFGCTIDDYDLGGLSAVEYGLINKEIERVDSGYRSALSVQSSLVMNPIY